MFSTEHSNALQSHFEASEMAEEKGMKVISIITESLKSRPPSEFEAETRTTTPTAVQSPPTKYGWRFYGSFVCLCVINLVCAIDASILSVALPTITTSISGTAIEGFWAGTSFLLTSTVFQPSWASFSHIFGRKPVLLCALVIFTIGTIIASVASTPAVLLAGRSVQGIGGGGMVSLTYVIVTDMVTLRERGKWFSLITLQWAIGSVGAPVIGGAIAEHANWRWLFWLNFPFIAIAFVGIPVCLKLTFRQTSMWAKVKRFDWAGSGLFVASLTSFLVPLTWGGIMYDWSSYHTLVPMLVGVVGLITFFLWQKFFSPEPLIRGSIFLTSTAKVGYLGTFLHGILTWSMLYYQPLYYEAVQGFGPTKAGIAIFPVTFTVAPSAVVVGLIIAKTGRYRPSIYIGWVLCTLGAGLLTLQGSATTTVQWIFLTLVVGVGAGILFSAQSFAVQASASNADLPFAGAMYSFFRALGQTFGVAMGGVIFQNQFRRSLERSTNALLQGNASEWARNAMAFVEVLRIMPEGKVKTLLVEAYVDGLRMVWIVMCALCGIALVLSLLFTKDISLERPLETEQAFIHDRKAPCVEEAVSKGES